MSQQAAREAAAQAMKQFGGKGVLSGTGAIVGLGALAYGVNSSLYNGSYRVLYHISNDLKSTEDTAQ